MNSERSLPVASVINPVAVSPEEDLPVATEEKKIDTQNQKPKTKTLSYIYMSSAAFAFLFLVLYFTFYEPEQKEQIFFSHSQLEEYCANQNNHEWNQYVFDNLKETSLFSYELAISGDIPAFAFQCNIGLSQSTFREVTFDLVDNVKMHKHAMKATDGSNIGTWNTFIFKYAFRTNGYTLNVSKNTFSTDVFDRGNSGWVEFQFKDVTEVKINEKFKEDVGHLELTFIADEENTVDATAAVNRFKNWKINYLTLNGFSSFSTENLSKKIIRKVTSLEFINTGYIDFPFYLLKRFQKLELLLAGNINELTNYPSEKKFEKIKTLGFRNRNSLMIPDNFLVNFPNIQGFYITKGNYQECDSSIKPRMGLEEDVYRILFNDPRFFTCVDLSGEPDLSLYENNVCTTIDTYQAVLETLEREFDNYFSLPSTCIPPHFFELLGVNYTSASSISLRWENAEIVAEDTFLTKAGHPVFPNVERIYVSAGTEVVYQNSFLGSKNFPKLNTIHLRNTWFETLPNDVFVGNEQNIERFGLSYGSLDIDNLFEIQLPKLTSLKIIDVYRNDFSHVPDLDRLTVGLTNLWLSHNSITTVFADDFCSGIHAPSLNLISLGGNPIEFVEDDAFRNCTNLTDLRLYDHLLNETEEEFKERTGFCQANNCQLYYESS
eukprot:snap_masked-scaffold_21-processed-gene-3.25-mRNA-1 protein AED:1.00 eAED:1.00 QI:0/-1/0/0/-1/1/1/0/660